MPMFYNIFKVTHIDIMSSPPPYYNDDQIKRLVKKEVKEQLTPTFWEAFGQQAMLEMRLRAIIDEKVPSILPTILNKNDGVVSRHVQLQLPSILAQQPYYVAAMNQQANNFKSMLDGHVPKLQGASDGIIQQSIDRVSNQNHIMSAMKENITAEVKGNMNRQTHELNTKIDRLHSNMYWGYGISAAVGAGVGYFCTNVISKL